MNVGIKTFLKSDQICYWTEIIVQNIQTVALLNNTKKSTLTMFLFLPFVLLPHTVSPNKTISFIKSKINHKVSSNRKSKAIDKRKRRHIAWQITVKHKMIEFSEIIERRDRELLLLTRF